MSNEASEIITEGWSEEDVVWSGHTRLYHLEPVGVGTPWVESLTSYLTRLAAAHHVHPRKLLLDEFHPYIPRAARAQTDCVRSAAISALLTSSRVRVLNGFAPSTRLMVQGLTVLTGRSDLQWLTFLPFQDIVSQTNLLRRVKAWCPQCFETWREQGRPIYEPLLWSLETLWICPLHGHLHMRCPYPDCARTSGFLTAQSYMGFCPWCNRWLGASPSRRWQRHRLSLDPDIRNHQQRIVTILGEALARTPLFPFPLQRAKTMEVLSSYLDATFQGNDEQAASHCGTTAWTLRAWLTGKEVPQITSLLHLCLSLGVSLAAILDGPVSRSSLVQRSLTGRCMSGRPCRERRPFSKRKAERALQNAIKRPHDPPMSLSRLAKKAGASPSQLSRCFPELCATLTSLYRAQMKHKQEQTFLRNCEAVSQAVLFLHEHEIYPSRRRLRQILQKPSIMSNPNIVAFLEAKLQEMGYR